MEKRTKIVCTIGPASSSPAVLRRLVEEGMDLARINFSHGSRDSNGKIIGSLKRLRRQTGANIAILQDLGGPKIRVGQLPEAGVALSAGQSVLLLPCSPALRYQEGGPIPVEYPALLQDVRPGARILLDDGLIELEAQKVTRRGLCCRVLHGGHLYSHKGVNFPDLVLSRGAPTAKDVEDLEFGLERGVDFVALSFVQTASDIQKVRRLVERSQSSAAIVAKLERGTAMQNLAAIVAASDALMLARGDLGIEADISMIPVYQKTAIRKANLLGVPVITATQMLDSMIRNPRPTRAEVTDVANAIYDGSDAIMLSGETAVGADPVAALRMMRRIANHVEQNLGLDRGWVRAQEQETGYSAELAVAHSVCQTAERLKARCIVAQTISGRTARLISMYRPNVPIVALTPVESTCRQLALVWGVRAVLLPRFEKDFLKTTAAGDRLLLAKGYVRPGDLVVVSAGIPASQTGGTNTMKLHTIGRD